MKSCAQSFLSPYFKLKDLGEARRFGDSASFECIGGTFRNLESELFLDTMY